MPVRTIVDTPGLRIVRTIPHVLRAALADPSTIRRRMAADLREIEATAGGVTPEHLRGRGWTAAQVKTHGEAAALLAQRWAIREDEPCAA